MELKKSDLLVGRNTVLDVTGSGTISVGPNVSAGPANWHVTGVIVQTSRPGRAPIPAVQVYLDVIDPSKSQGMTYDGSFTPSRRADVKLIRGQQLIIVWTGGQVGDVASVTLSGEKW
jgi:hypothetical protein